MTPEYLVEHYFKEKVRLRSVSKISDTNKILLANGITILSLSEYDRQYTHTPELKEIYLAISNYKTSKRIDKIENLFEDRKTKTLKKFYQTKKSLYQNITSSKVDQINYLKEQSKNAEAANIITSCFNKSENKEFVRQYDVTKQIILQIKINQFEINEKLLNINIDGNPELILESLASIIEKPERLSICNIEIESEWLTFPFKWFIDKLTIGEYRNLYYKFKDGDSLTDFIEQYIESNKNVIEKRFDNHILNSFSERSIIIQNCILTYSQGLFSSVMYSILPTIEGILWDFADLYDKFEKPLFKTVNSKRVLLQSNGKEMMNFTIGDLMNKTAIKDFFDEHFISYFCNELYNERNLILHGVDVNSFNKTNCAKKLLTFEYLTVVINNFITQHFFSEMNNIFDDEKLENITETNKISIGDEVSFKALVKKYR
ncbi:hypothetical protein PGH12_01310 [Chryseobacterium wangxinyae]|uniref:hypothetical protein n=1 Tax=Chryseobacterium sp. CY350 TaxID=2997336 RepID=UPI00226F1FFE|nr:hypothetical protein [Chryseobacterium sp. CY350]MCY0977181.1 hypothetical protein [Chryseobacterium sp. CY350]WBZ95798.1 hypothetical protein PGH12_01310 [Chryseobacterium sp. CY350]